MRFFLFILAILSAVSSADCQNVIVDGIPRDTSFTLHSAYIKAKKDRPYIEKAYPRLLNSILSYRNIVYSKPTEGRELVLNVYKSVIGHDKKPALIMVFGGGWSSGDLSLQVPMAIKIASKGYVTIPVEYRLSPEAQYPAAVHDLKTAVRWVKENADEYGIDTTRIAISGCSAGGQLATLIGTTNGQTAYEEKREYPNHSSDVQAVINIDGVSDFMKSELANNLAALDKNKPAPAAIRWLGTIEENRDNWIAASSVYHVTERSAPICFINSSIPRFHDGRDEMIEKLSTYGIYTEVHEIPDTPHPFWLFKPWFDTNVGYMVGFLDKMFK